MPAYDKSTGGWHAPRLRAAISCVATCPLPFAARAARCWGVGCGVCGWVGGFGGSGRYGSIVPTGKANGWDVLDLVANQQGAAGNATLAYYAAGYLEVGRFAQLQWLH